MGFPKYKTIEKKGWFFTSTEKVPDGWEDHGIVPPVMDIDSYVHFMCKVCRSRVRIGKEKDVVFRYCPLCMVKN